MKKIAFVLLALISLTWQINAAAPLMTPAPRLAPAPLAGMALFMFAVQATDVSGGLITLEALGGSADGSSDNLSAFRKLGTAVASRKNTTVVMRPNGTYRMTKSVRSREGVKWDFNGATLRFDVTNLDCAGMQLTSNNVEVINGTIDMRITGNTAGATGDVGSPLVIGDDADTYNNEDCTGVGSYGSDPHNVRVINMTLTGNRIQGFAGLCVFSGHNIYIDGIKFPASNKLAIGLVITAGVADVNMNGDTDVSYHPYNITARNFDFGDQTYTAISPFEPVMVGVSGARSGLLLENFNARTVTGGPFLRYSASDQGITRLDIGTITAGGTGYSTASGVATTGGTGTGLTVNITSVSGGAITGLTINNKGTGSYVPSNPGQGGYVAGQTLTVTGGGGNATFTLAGPAAEIVHSAYHATTFKNFVCTNCLSGGFYNDVNGDNAIPPVEYSGPVVFEDFKLRGGGSGIGVRSLKARDFIYRNGDISNFDQGFWVDDNSQRTYISRTRSYRNGAEGFLIFSSMLTDPIDTVLEDVEAYLNGQDSGGDGATGVHDYGTRTKIIRGLFGHSDPTLEASQDFAILIDETASGAVIQNNHCRSTRTQVGGAGGGVCWGLGDATSYAAIAEFTGNTHYGTAWASATAYTLGATVRRATRDDEFCVWQATVAGTSGGSEPAWSACTAGASTVDNTITWTAQQVRTGIPLSRGTKVDIWCNVYTPVFTAVMNSPTFAAATETRYCRYGDTVTVWPVVGVTGVAANAPTQTKFGISLPIYTNMATTNVDLSGSGSLDLAVAGAFIYADTVNDRAQVDYWATVTTGHSVYGSFTYRLIP